MQYYLTCNRQSLRQKSESNASLTYSATETNNKWSNFAHTERRINRSRVWCSDLFVYCFLERLLASAEELAAACGHWSLIAISGVILASNLRLPAFNPSSHSKDLGRG